MSRLIVAITFFILTVCHHHVSSSEADVNNTSPEVKNICDADDPVSIIAQADECIVDLFMKEVISGCRFVSYGSSDVAIATNTFCTANDALKKEMDSLFEVCLIEKGLTAEMMQLEWATNCAFCQNLDLVNKTEVCFEKSPLKTHWLECRGIVYETQNAMDAAQKYCKLDRDARLLSDRLFDECLMARNVTRDNFESSVTDC